MKVIPLTSSEHRPGNRPVGQKCLSPFPLHVLYTCSDCKPSEPPVHLSIHSLNKMIEIMAVATASSSGSDLHEEAGNAVST